MMGIEQRKLKGKLERILLAIKKALCEGFFMKYNATGLSNQYDLFQIFPHIQAWFGLV